MNLSTYRFVLFKKLFFSFSHMCMFAALAFIREHMRQKAIRIGHPIRPKTILYDCRT